MKKLESLSVTRLTNLEFGQHIKSIQDNISGNRKAKITVQDPILQQYLEELNKRITAYDKAMMQITKSDETAKIVQAEGIRTKALISMQRYLSVYEFTPNAEQLLQFKSLQTLFNKFRGLQSWNYEEQTNGISALLADLKGEKYSKSVASLTMGDYVTVLQETHEIFKTIFAARFQERSEKEIFNVKELKTALKNTYEKLVQYVLVMAIAIDNDEFNKALSIINTVRKYYADMLAKRNSITKTEPPIPVIALP